MSAEARPRAAESLSCCQCRPAAAPQLLLQPHCCCCWQSLTHVLLRYNLLLQSLQHSDQLAFKYVVRRVSPSCRLPQAAHRPAGRCTGSKSREFRLAGSGATRLRLPIAGGETVLRARLVFLPPAAAAEAHRLLPTNCSMGRHICSVSRSLNSSSIVANLVMFSHFPLVM